jgi:hypothetical protein
MPRPLPSPLREDETLSQARDAFHRQGTLRLMPESLPTSCAVTCVSATIRLSAPLDPRLPALRFRDARGYRGLDPRPCSSSASRCSRVTPKRASLDQAAAQRLLQLTTDARTHSRASDSRVSVRPASFRSDAELALDFDTLFYGASTSPSRRRITRAASRDSPSEASPTSLQERRETRPRKPSSDRNAACGRRLDPTTVCGDGRWKTALDCSGRANPERRTLPHAAGCRRTTWVKVPLLIELLEHPWVSSILRTVGWMLPPSS